MRVIAGIYRSRKLKSVPGLDVRPTPDRLRESLFSVLAPRIEGVTFIDAYAGSGSVGIEALSRGAASVVFLEQNTRALAVLRENLESLGIAVAARIVRGQAATQIASLQADILFLDPPYDATAQYELSLNAAGTRDYPLVIAQHPTRLLLQDDYGSLARTRVLKQGDNSLSFFERE